MPGVFLNFLALQADRHSAEARVKRIRRDGKDALGAAIFIELSIFRVLRHQQLIIDALGRHEHQRIVERMLILQNVFLRDRIGMLADGHRKFAP